MYAWGGGRNPDWPGPDLIEQEPRLRVFTKDSPESRIGKWAYDPSRPREDPPHIQRTQEGSWTSCNGLGFLLGGLFISNGTSASPGLVIYNMSSNSWRNESETSMVFGAAPRQGTHRQGSAVCLPTMGTENKGIMVFLAGERLNRGRTGDREDVKMDEVGFYDIGTNAFYRQKTTFDGAAPPARRRPCAVAARSSDGRSYEIFLFAGDGQPAEVSVLTIPGFRWFQTPRNSEMENRRANTACAVVGKRQMIAVGGTADMSSWTPPNSWQKGLKIYDMVNLTWGDYFNASAEVYQSPKMVSDWYNEGNVAEWNDGNEKLFQAWASRPPIDAGPNIGAIVWGSVAGAVVLAAVVAAFLFWHRRRKRGQEAQTIVEEDAWKQQQQHHQGPLPQLECRNVPHEMHAESGLKSPSPYELPARSKPQELPETPSCADYSLSPRFTKKPGW